MKFIDLSHSISADLAVFPGDTPVQLRKDKEISKDGYNNFQLNTGMHVGDSRRRTDAFNLRSQVHF